MIKTEIKAPKFTDQAIIAAADRLLKGYVDKVGSEHLRMNGLHFDDVYKHVIYPRFGVEIVQDEELGNDEDGEPLLGRYDVASNTAFIAPWLSDDPRLEFTKWHEVLGHGALQGEWLRQEQQRVVEVTDASLSAKTMRRLERQANLLAANAAAPEWWVRWAMHKVIPGRSQFPFYEPCRYYLDVQGLSVQKYVTDFRDLCWWIGAKISGHFGGLSAEAIGYRLSELGIVVDRSFEGLRLFRRSKASSMMACA